MVQYLERFPFFHPRSQGQDTQDNHGKYNTEKSVLGSHPEVKHDSGIMVIRNETYKCYNILDHKTKQENIKQLYELIINKRNEIHEIIFPNRLTKIFFDIEGEFTTMEKVSEARGRVVKAFSTCIPMAMSDLYTTQDKGKDFINENVNILYFDNSRQVTFKSDNDVSPSSFVSILGSDSTLEKKPYKLSMHVIFSNTYMLDIYHVKQFVSWFMREHLDTYDSDIIDWIDMSIYRQYGSMRFPYTRKKNCGGYSMQMVPVSDSIMHRNENVDMDFLSKSSLQLFDVNEIFPLVHRLFKSKEKSEEGLIVINESAQNKIVDLIMNHTDIGNSFALYKIINNRIELHRIKSKYCNICHVVHDNDRKFITVHQSKGKNYCVFRCYKNPSKGEILDLPDDELNTPEILEGIKIYGDSPEKKKDSTSTKATYITELVKIQDKLATEDEKLHGINSTVGKSFITDEKKLFNYPEDFETIFVRGGMGIGKTVSLIDYLGKRLNQNERITIVVLSFRRTFSSKMTEDLRHLGFKSYSEIDGPISHTRIVIQAESFGRITYLDTNIDILVMDEIKSIFSQITGSHSESHFSSSFAKLHQSIKTAETLICADAYLDSDVINTINSVRNYKQSCLLWNKFPNEKQRTYFITHRIAVILGAIEESISQNQKIAIACYSIKYSEAIRSMLIDNGMSSDDILVYNSNTDDIIKREHFANVNKYWDEARVIIFTSTVKAGISCTLKFDTVFGIFSCTEIKMAAEDYIQMIGRVRDCNNFKICIMQTTGDFNTDPKFICNSIYQSSRVRLYLNVSRYSSNRIVSYKHDLAMFIYICNKIMNLRSRADFIRRFCVLFKQYGARIEELPATASTYIDLPTLHNYCSMYDKSQAVLIKKANNITDEVYDELKDKIHSGKEISSDERYAIKKEEFKRIFNIYYKNIEPDMILKYYKNSMIRPYMLLNSMMNIKNPDNYIECSGIRHLLNLMTDPETSSIKFVSHVCSGTLIYNYGCILKSMGFSDWYDNKVIDRAECEKIIEKNKKHIAKNLDVIYSETKNFKKVKHFSGKDLLTMVNNSLSRFLRIKLFHSKADAILRIHWPTDDFKFVILPDTYCDSKTLRHIASIFGDKIRDISTEVNGRPTIIISKHVVDHIKKYINDTILFHMF